MNEMYETMNKLSQGSLDAARRLGEINLRVGERMLAEQISLANAWLETGTKNLELLGNAKGYQEIAAGQAEMARELGQKVMASYKVGTEIAAEAREELTKLVEEGVQKAGENLKQAASKKAA